MRYLKKFNESKGNFLTDESSIRDIMYKLNLVGKYRINSDGTVDVEGNVTYNLFNAGLDYIPIQFGYVSGFFVLGDKRVKSLIGSPRIVGTDFHSSDVTSLEGSPDVVGRGFYCNRTSITDLKGAPKQVGSFYAMNCTKLTSLEGLPKLIDNEILLDNCSNLWYPGDLRDVKIGELTESLVEFNNTPLSMLVSAFAVEKEGLQDFKHFQESLDYNYLKPPMTWCGKEFPALDLFRFREALDELDIEIDFQERRNVKGIIEQRVILKSPYKDFWVYPENIGRYIFVNERGQRVDIEGNLISESQASYLNGRPDWGL